MELTSEQALQKGIEAHKEGKAQEADRYYTAILKANPKHPDANHNMGVLAVGVGKVEAALPFFKTALETNPDVAQFWLSYIDALIKLDRIADAKAVLEQAKGKGAKSDAFSKLEKRLAGIESTSNMPANAQELPQGLLKNLVNLYTQGQYQEALNEASKLLNDFPSSVIVYNIIGAANEGLGKLEEAIEAYNKALSIKPDFAEAYNNMSNALKGQGKLEEAIEAYNKALSINPDYAEAHYNMGTTLKDQGKLEQAIEAFQKALSIKSDFAEAHYNIGVTFTDLGKLEEAIEAYTKAISIKPDYAAAYNNMGAVLKDQSKLTEAVEAYKKALSINPNHADAYNNMGITLQEQGKLDEAIEAYKKANELNPKFSIEMVLSELLLKYRKDASAALKLLESALFKNQRDTRALAYKTIALRGLGRFEEAEKLINFSTLVQTENIQRYTNENIIDFNKELLRKLMEHPKRAPELDLQGWAIRGGTAIRNLFTNADPVIKSFEKMLRKAIDDRISNLPNGHDHPFIIQQPINYRLNCWANLLEAGDYQSNHIHDNGWMSGVYYVSVPEPKAQSSANAGWIEFNRAGYDLPHFGEETGIELIQPKPGLLIFFPSYVWHGTIPYSGAQNRVSISFDVELI